MSHMLVCWKRMSPLLSCVVVLLLACVPSSTQTLSTPPADEKALRAATRGLCKAHVAMVGEVATHGDGHTLAFKVALVERLIDECGFDAVFFEANQEEFLHLNQRLRSGEAVSSEALLTAAGGLWRFYKEFQPLAPFLITRAKAGRVFLGGLDDQLGQLGQDYANTEMIAELTSRLPQQERGSCGKALQKRIDMEYPEASPYAESDRTQIRNCLAAMQAASSADTSASALSKQERQEMISATQRWVSRDFSSDGEGMANRDRSMFKTFEWLQASLPKKSKIIVWAATVHVAKQGDPIWGDRAGTNLGSLIHREYGNRARSVGFSALGGSFRQGKGKFPALPVAPADSVEARALQASDAGAVYVGSKRLAGMGRRPGAFFYHSYQALAWSTFLDSAVVFRLERPPVDLR